MDVAHILMIGLILLINMKVERLIIVTVIEVEMDKLYLLSMETMTDEYDLM